MKNNTKPIFAIHGGGNIGLGLMADIVSRSPIDFQIIATSSNQFINRLINSKNEFCLYHDNKNITKINNIHMIDSTKQSNIIKIYANTDMVAICLTEDALINTSSSIAKGLITRNRLNKNKLKVLVLMNKQNCDEFAQVTIEKALIDQHKSTRTIKKILNNIQFIPTMADRIINRIANERIMIQLEDQLHKLVKNPRDILKKTDKLSRIVKKFDLKFFPFNAEKDFSLYVPEYFKEANRFPSIKIVKNLNQFITIKNKYINGPHAILAWVGGLMGYDKISEAIKNPIIFNFIKNMMEKEIAPILQAVYPKITYQELESLKILFLKRCANIDDPITRVGRDPLRKLDRDGCVRGVVELCQQHHLSIATPKLEKGIAAGIMYALKKIDPINSECKKIREIFYKNESYQAVLCYKGPYGNGNYPGLDPIKDNLLVKKIIANAKAFSIPETFHF